MAQIKREPYNPLLKSYPDSKKINAVSIGAETMYTRLLARSDDRAHYYAAPKMLLAKLFTDRWFKGEVDLAEMELWTEQLERQELITGYAVEGETYLELVNCKKCLRSDLRPDIQFPERTADNAVILSARIRAENIGLTVPSTQPNPTQPNPLAPVPGEAVLPVGFAGFWKAWPKHFRKQGRAKCLAWWKKQKLEPIATKVIDALQRCKASRDWTKEGGQFIPFPMSWLNNTPWLTDASEMEEEKRDPKAAVERAMSEVAAKRDADRLARIALLKELPAEKLERLKQLAIDHAPENLREKYAAANWMNGWKLAIAMCDELAREKLLEVA